MRRPDTPTETITAVKLRIGTRQSKLALWQAHHVRDRLTALGAEVEIVGITTSGDRLLDASLARLGGKGLFLKEIEQALAAGEVDLAVHSAKDVPAELDNGFVIAAFGSRADVRDAWLARADVPLGELPAGARVGTSSLRRVAQLRALRPDIDLVPVRGNVDTRLGKLADGAFDAIVLASAGLDRLGLAHHISTRFDVDTMLPAVGQGALALECLAEATAVRDCLAALDEIDVRRTVTCERALSAALGADCTLPLAAWCRLGPVGLQLDARVGDPDTGQLLAVSVQGNDPGTLAAEAARQLLAAGAGPIIDAQRAR